ncbi:MAG: hypothetical protein R3A80_09640 [Bdellovibrionota bacterium]
MNKSVLLLLGVLTFSAFASSPEVIKEYLLIQEKLAADSTEGVADAAKKIVSLEKKSKVSLAAQKLVALNEIKEIRKEFKKLSTEIIAATPKKDLKDAKVAFCPMANAKWLQKGDEIRNPYYGSSMLECGGFE